MPHPARRRLLGGSLVSLLIVLASPLAVSGHSEVKSSVPGDGATVPSPFSGPVVLMFTLSLASGSKADLVGSDGSKVASATVDPSGPTMTFNLASPLGPGAYQVLWTSIGDDGDLLRGISEFSVATGTTPTAEPSSATARPASGVAPSQAAPTDAPSLAPSPAGSDTGAGAGDAVLPIVVAFIVVAAGALHLVRRSRPA